MAHGDASKAKLTAVFEKRINELEAAARTQAEQFRTFNTWRKWHTPTELNNANLYDTPGMSSPTWDRNEINQIYSNDVMGGSADKGGCSGGAIAMTLQCDFLAAEERAWRARHMSPVRAACHAHGRIKAHGISGKSNFSVLKKLIDSYILASTSDGRGGAFNGFQGDIGAGGTGIA